MRLVAHGTGLDESMAGNSGGAGGAFRKIGTDLMSDARDANSRRRHADKRANDGKCQEACAPEGLHHTNYLQDIRRV